MSLISCNECGKEVSSKADTCPNCGNPIKRKRKNNKNFKISKKKIIICSLLIALAIFIGFTIKNTKQKAEENKQRIISEEYQKDLLDISYDLLLGASQAEKCGNLITKVWHNAIWEEKDDETDKYTRKNNGTGDFYDDFNDSLSVLFESDEYKKMVSSIKENKNKVKNEMKNMKNPPEEWKEAYDDLKEYYDDYLEFTNLVLDPSGNLNSYSSKFSDLDSKVSKDYSRMEYYFDN